MAIYRDIVMLMHASMQMLLYRYGIKCFDGRLENKTSPMVHLNLAAQRALETPTVSYLFSTEVWKNAKELWTLTEADLACAEDEAKDLKPLVKSEEHYSTAVCPDVQLRSCSSNRLGTYEGN
ncbi:unnamed protein product [Pleuronectes platessa]|uniref:Uncharacterized protein n=1 Tax=Pleuronectes platessa TaxID=8262 RepID=A0A9N7VCZ9_PLEPL|nr:unnamed protein product [Pleuronectes platessa]